jgi:hypothetical protein
MTPNELDHKRQRARDYYWENAEECRRKSREGAAADRSKARKRCAEYYRKHHIPKPRKRKTEEEIRAAGRKRNSEYHKKKKDEIRERKKKYRSDHPEIFESEDFKQKSRKAKRDYYEAHKDRWEMTREDMDRANELRREHYEKSEEMRVKRKDAAKAWERSNPKKVKANRLKTYGITLEEFEELLASQGGKCAICGMSDTIDPKMFPIVDHCHTNNHVRGILCGKCNKGIGLFGNSPALLRRAAKYLERNGLFGPIQKPTQPGGSDVHESDDGHASRSEALA